MDRTDQVDAVGFRHLSLRENLARARLDVELAGFREELLLVLLVACLTVNPCEREVQPRLVGECLRRELRVEDRELQRLDGVVARALLLELARPMMPGEEVLNLLLRLRCDAVQEVALVLGVAAVLTDPDAVVVRIDVLVVRAEVVVDRLGNEARAHFRRTRFHAADRAGLLHHIEIILFSHCIRSPLL